MKKFLTALAALTFSSASASAQTTAPINVEVSASEEFQEKLEDDYGERELKRLAKDITKDLTRAMEKSGTSPAKIDVTILDARPNRPTFEQLSERAGLSLRSFSTGGMDMKAIAYDASGNILGELEYDWFEHDIRFAQGRTTWSDARRASQIFARKFAKQIAG